MIAGLSIALGFFLTALGAFGIVGFGPVYQVTYFAITLWALLIAMTFLYLYLRQKTLLSLGMFFSWTGTAGTQGWWWSYNHFNRPEWMADNPLLFIALAFYGAGAWLHFRSFRHASEIDNRIWEVTAVLAVLISALVYTLR